MTLLHKIVHVLKTERWAMLGAAICALSFFGVYAIDLAKIFSASPDVMPRLADYY